MIRQSTDTRTLFKFYTYNLVGKDVVIPIRGVDYNDAWDVFKKLYTGRDGTVPLVDYVRLEY